MNTPSKIHYLHYILCFIDNKFRINDEIDKTFCSASIIGENDDIFLSKQGNSYQLLVCNNKCYIQLLGTKNSVLLQEKSWMKPYLRDHLAKINKFDNYTFKKFIRKKNIAHEKYTIFYIREINIKMKLELFEKIINDPFNYKKLYTSEELFFICHSHAFTIMDNQFYILKNILFLITQKLFDIENIYLILMNFVAHKNPKSSFLEKFANLNYATDENDFQSKINVFLEICHDLKSHDSFVLDLHAWKCTITNMFILIHYTFYFHILSNENDSILKIYNHVDAKSVFCIYTDNLDIILSLINENCIFSFKFFHSLGFDILFYLFRNTQMININIDITEFIQKIYQYDKNKIIDESMKLHHFIETLIKRTAKQIIIRTGIYQFIIQNNVSEINLIRPNREKDDQFFFDVVIFMCQKIEILGIEKIACPLKSIVRTIVFDFFNQNTNNIENVTIGYYKNSFDHFNNHELSASEISSVNTDENEVEEIDFDRFEQQFLEIESIWISESCGLIIWNEIYLEGIIDQKYTVLIPKLLSNKKQFVSRIKEFFDFERRKDRKNTNHTNNYSDSFYLPLQSKNQLMFDIYFQHKDDSFYVSEQNVYTSNFENRNPILSECNCLNTNDNIEIHHYQRSITRYVKSYQILETNLHDSLVGITKFNLQKFEIKTSNFYFIFEQLLELKSISMNLSKIRKYTDKSSSSIIIESCYVTFLGNSYFTINNITFHNCILESIFHIVTDVFSKSNHYLKFDDLFLSQYIIIFDFLQICSTSLKNNIVIQKQNLHYIIELKNCNTKFYDDVPNNIAGLILNNCEIIAKNNILCFEKNIAKYEIKNYVSSMNISEKIINFTYRKLNASLSIQNSILPKEFSICGIFQGMQIENCVLSSNLDTFAQIWTIKNHQGEFSIKNYIDKASSNDENNEITKNLKYFRMKNFELNILQNLKVDEMIIENCSIKTIRNFQSKVIRIKNTNCAFQLKNAKGKIQNFRSDSLNVIISQNTHMMIGNFIK